MSRTRGTGPARQAASSLWLVETLATVLVGLFLLAGIVQLAATRAADQHHESALMRRQAEGRTALEAVARELRMAGYAGCARLADLIRGNPDGLPRGFAAAEPIGGETRIGAHNAFGAVAGTDVLRVRRLSVRAATLGEDMSTPAGVIPIAAVPEGFDAGGPLAIADCDGIDFFSAAAVSATGLQPRSPLAKSYRAGSRVMAPRELTFFIGRNAAGRPTLRRAGHRPAELLEGVADMEILYGEDTDGDGPPDRYRDATAVATWSRVRSVRVALLLHLGSAGDPKSRPQVLTWRGEARADGPPALVVATTVALRNQLP